MKPRIAFDVHMMGTRQTGNETYAAELSRALARERESIDLVLYGTSRADGLPSGVRVRRLPRFPDAVRIVAAYPALALRDRIDLLHVTYVAPPLITCRTVVSVHDVTFKLFPEHFSMRDLMVLDRLVGQSARRAAVVLALSESGKRDIVRVLGVAEDRVVVAPLAAGSQFNLDAGTASRISELRRRLSLPERYVLAVGNLQPRKNLPRLVRAFAIIATEFPGVDLVLAGQRGHQGSEVARAIRDAGLGSRVRELGYVHAAELPALYAGADVFCYPSLYEGFGLPVLEAMSCGTAVLTADSSSLPEVAGTAAMLVDPQSDTEIAAGLRMLLQDSNLRKRIGAAGVDRAACFSWERTAQVTIGAYYRALGLAA